MASVRGKHTVYIVKACTSRLLFSAISQERKLMDIQNFRFLMPHDLDLFRRGFLATLIGTLKLKLTASSFNLFLIFKG